MPKIILFTAFLLLGATPALAEEGASEAKAPAEASSIIKEVRVGGGLPYGLEVLGRWGGRLGERVEAGGTAGFSPLLMSPSVGVYGKVYVDSEKKYYLVGDHRYTPVLIGSSDMKGIRTTSFGAGKRLDSGASLEIAYTDATRSHKDFCNVDDCVPNGTSKHRGLMLYYGAAF